MTITSMTETERKYEVDASIQVPDLTGIGDVLFEDTVTLRAVYYDTVDGALAARLHTLRRRTGGSDEGWHLKTPGTDGRTEYHAPLGAPSSTASITRTGAPEAPPAALTDLVRSIIRDRTLVEIARITTQRTIAHVLDESGAPVVEIADDQVSATDVHTGILRLWREWEAELLTAAPSDQHKRRALLDSVEEKLVEAGATPARSLSKLAQATGRTSLAPKNSSWALKGTPDKSSTALEVAAAIIRELTDAIIAADPHVRADVPDAVHTMRTAVRRLRTVLAVVRGILDRDVTDGIRDHLRELGDVLGTARDAEVRSIRAAEMLGTIRAAEPAKPGERGEPGGDGDGERDSTVTVAAGTLAPDADLTRRIVGDSRGEYRARLIEVVEFLASPRYFALLDELDALIARPPLTDLSVLPAGEEFRLILRAQGKRARKRLRRARRDDLASLHEARKAARRLRHTADALTTGAGAIFGSKARALSEASERIQDVIGDHRDATLSADRLDATAAEASQAGENTAGYGILASLERRAALESLEKIEPAIADLRRATSSY